MIKKSILLLLFTLFVLSCSVQKRKYQKGYFVNWKHSGKQEQTISKNETQSYHQSIVKNNSFQEKHISASVTKELEQVKPPKPNIFLSPDSCDVVIFKDGSEKRVKVMEVASTQIRYKNCDMPDGPVFISNKSEIFMITYVSGIKEVFKTEVAPVSSSIPQKNTTYQQKEKQQKRHTAMATSAFIFSLIGIYPLFFISSIIAVILSTIHLNRIQTDPEHYGGEKKAKVAQIIGIIGTAVGILLIALIVLSL